MTEMPSFLADLWTESRPTFLTQADEAAEAAERWTADGSDGESFEALRHRAHKLAGSLGSFAAALRPAPADSPFERAAADARALNDLVSQEGQAAAEPVRRQSSDLARSLRASLDQTS